MSYLRNFWYCAAWGPELSRKPLARTLLDEKVVLYRKEAGGLIALGNVCPHRFAPLDQGKLHGDVLACPYHGLQFGENGGCVHNPHGDLIPATLRVKSYPIVERYGAAWMWMGDPALADETAIPDFNEHSDPAFRSIYSHIPIQGSYELVSDNLLDLSHTQYLHAVLTHDHDPEARSEFRIEQDGNTITTIQNHLNVSQTGFQRFIWPAGPQRSDNWGGIRWQPPANMRLKIQMAPVGGTPQKDGQIAWGAELVTPETATTCHYFWSFARNFRLDEPGLDEALRQAIESVFTNEDGAMIAKVQSNMGTETDLMAMRPVILPTDKAAVLARRVIRNLLRKEAAVAIPESGPQVPKTEEV